MAFYGERFLRDDEEDIWEELKRMLMNPVSEEEKTLKKQQEQAKINTFLEKMFPADTKILKEKEPYLRYEDLLETPKKNPLLPESSLLSKANIEKVNLEGYKNKLPKLEEVREKVKEIYPDIEKIGKSETPKKALGRVAQVASVLPVGANSGPALARGVGVVAKKMAPHIGRKLSEQISRGAVTGATSGAIEGLGRGLAEDKNPAKTIAQDAIGGAVLGSTVGAVGGNIEKATRGKELRKINSLEGKTSEQMKKIRKDATNFYDDYIKGTYVKRKDMHPIYFGNTGIKEVKSRSPHNIKILPDLKKQIKTGDKVSSRYDYERKDISNFDIIKNAKNDKTYEYQIARDKSLGNKFYTIKDISNKKTDSPLTGWNQNPGLEKSPTDIIEHVSSNFNPNRLKSPKTLDEWLEELRRKRRLRGF